MSLVITETSPVASDSTTIGDMNASEPDITVAAMTIPMVGECFKVLL